MCMAFYPCSQQRAALAHLNEYIRSKPAGQPLGVTHHWLICGIQTDDIEVPGHILIRIMWKSVGCSLSVQTERLKGK